VLSAIHAQVYFPIYANDLKSVARCLGSNGRRGRLGASVVWRHAWEETGNPETKELLLTYNRDDCSALAAVTAAVRSYGADSAPADIGQGPLAAGVDAIKWPGRWRFGQPEFALPEFALITKCAYFDYQRDKVICRTSPAVKESIARKKRSQPPAYRVNRDVECERPIACPNCGEYRLHNISGTKSF